MSSETAEKMEKGITKMEGIVHRFTCRPPKPGQADRYQLIRDTALSLALLIDAQTPPSREQSLAMTKLEEAVMWANAAIARNE